MNKPMTRRGCVLGVLIWAVLMALPVCGVVAALRGEVAWERGPFVEDRVWLVRVDEGSRGERVSGLAYGSMRISAGRPGQDVPVCVTTHVYFWMWRGENEAVTYCECYRPLGAGEYEAAGACE
jgi:hypothetical protein